MGCSNFFFFSPPLNVSVLKSFTETFDFVKIEFDEALRLASITQSLVSLHYLLTSVINQHARKFLKTFRLPGEAQKIDRMMESFAQRFYSQNSEMGIFVNSGILSHPFSLLSSLIGKQILATFWRLP